MAARPTVRIGRTCHACRAQHDTDSRRCSSCGEIANPSEPDPAQGWSSPRLAPAGSVRSALRRSATDSQMGRVNGDFWLENQELRAKILDLESRLEELQADNAALQGLAQTSYDKANKKIMKKVSFTLPTEPTSSESEKMGMLKVQRARLLWKSAILAVRLQNSVTTKNILKLIVSGVKIQHQEAQNELQQKLKDHVLASEQQCRSGAETQIVHMLRDEKVALEQILKDQTFAMQRSAHLGLAASPGDPLLAERGALTQTIVTWDKDACSSAPLAGLALSQALRPTESAPGGSLQALLDELRRENEELKGYTGLLEVKLADAVVDQEEMDALRLRVRQLEKVAWAVEPAQASQGQHGAEGYTSAWCAFRGSICSVGRSGNTPFANPPFVLSGADCDDVGSLPGFSASSGLQSK